MKTRSAADGSKKRRRSGAGESATILDGFACKARVRSQVLPTLAKSHAALSAGWRRLASVRQDAAHLTTIELSRLSVRYALYARLLTCVQTRLLFFLSCFIILRCAFRCAFAYFFIAFCCFLAAFRI